MNPLSPVNGNGSKTALCPAWCRPGVLHYIEPVWQLVGRTVWWRMGRKHVTAALDRRDEAGGDVIVAHTRGQSINRRLPLRMMNFAGDAIVSNDPCVVLCQRHEDEYASAVLCACNPAEQKLFERGTMCSRTLHRAWNKREP